jgi:hypothetical protein
MRRDELGVRVHLLDETHLCPLGLQLHDHRDAAPALQLTKREHVAHDLPAPIRSAKSPTIATPVDDGRK